jgi:ABC-type multidrug transport system fused ATPase/permease subunit
MLTTVRRALELLDRPDRRKVALVSMVSSAGSVVQALVLLSLMPFIVLLTNPEMFDDHPLVMRIARLLGIEAYSTFVVVLGGVTAAVLTLGNLFVAAEHMFTFRFIERLTHRTTARVLRNVLAQPWERIGGRHAAALGDVVVGQVQRVTQDVVGSAIALVSQVALLVFIVVVLLVLNPVTTAVALGGLVAAYAVLYFLTRRRIREGGEELTQVGAQIATTVKEALDGAREIRIRQAEGFFARRFERAHQRALRLSTHYEFQRAMPHYLLESVVFAGFVAVSLYFLLRTDDAGMALSWLALYAFSVYRLVPALAAIFDCAADIQHNADAIRVIAPFCAPQQSATASAASVSAPRRHIRFEGVGYRHPGRAEDQIQGLDLVIPAGRSVCLFGPSGAGKSTLLNLVAGLLHPQQGRMYSDDAVVDESSAGAWREHIGYVPQPVYLFADSLASNIAFAEEPDEIDAQRIARVAELANLAPVIARLPQGLHSPVGEHGTSLSGGERQRVGIARALYRDPAVLLFDESFANLDAQNRHAILDRLFAMPGRTLLFSSHERDVVERCDCIVVIEHGRVVAQGSYQELLAASPRFVELLSRLESGERG